MITLCFVLWLSFFSFVSPVPTGETFHVGSERSAVCGELGKSVFLSVNYTLTRGKQLLDLSWDFKKDTEYWKIYTFNGKSKFFKDYESRVQVFQNGSLLLEALNYSDAGRYIFTVAEEGGAEKETTVELCVEDAVQEPTIEQTPGTAHSGETVSLVCRAPNIGNMQLYWQGVNLSSASSETKFLEGFQYTNIQITAHRCDTFICVARNSVSQKLARHTLNGSEELCENCDPLCTEPKPLSTELVALPIFLVVVFVTIVGIGICCCRKRKCDNRRCKEKDTY
ncbi:hepatic and glial cell adhesion molecule-like [Lepisosteus oculatus]|uniref:hepatic and glial cell adhesion molecule-like n=1 Tax=Lepisosteus oculatus TaxID=7918 RepID=UPI0007401D1F|nr:PREDICTED: hepatocyte cell adhesion molecule-like [Lepisosteus oculatus]XP_015193215.1 PREDICTED: hepatocyte cell adhesion molecule-like [Lepisosteus oculatus]